MNDTDPPKVWTLVKGAALLISLAAICLLFFLLGRRCSPSEGGGGFNQTVTIVRDTVRLERTVERPVAVAVEKVRTDTLTVSIERIVERGPDSLSLTLPIESKVYEVPVATDSISGNLRAVVSGYAVSLDTLSYSFDIPRESTVMTKRRRWGFNVGPAVGVGYTGKGFAPYVGIGFQWGYSF